MGVAIRVRAGNDSRRQRTTGEATHDHRDVGASDDQPRPPLACRARNAVDGRDRFHRIGTEMACAGEADDPGHDWPPGGSWTYAVCGVWKELQTDQASGMEGMRPWRKAASWISLGLAHIGDESIDLEHPDEGILVNHRGDRPIGVQRRYTQEIAELLGCGLHRRRAELDMLPDVAGRNVRDLRRIKEKIDHGQGMDDPASPGGGLASHQRRGTFATQDRRQRTAEVLIFLVQGGMTEGIGELNDLLETCLHLFSDQQTKFIIRFVRVLETARPAH